MESVMIFGATRGVGLELVRILRARSVGVVAMARPPSETAELDRLGVEVVRGDALSARDVAAAFDALGEGGQVVSTLGGAFGTPPIVDHEGNARIIEEAEARGVARFVFVTSLGCGETRPHMAPRVAAVLGPIVDAKTRAEERLVRSSLDWTILRPGGLRSEPATGRGVLSEDPEIHGFVHRADVAQLVARVLRDPSTVGKKLAAVDAELAHGPKPLEPIPLRPLDAPGGPDPCGSGRSP